MVLSLDAYKRIWRPLYLLNLRTTQMHNEYSSPDKKPEQNCYQHLFLFFLIHMSVKTQASITLAFHLGYINHYFII